MLFPLAGLARKYGAHAPRVRLQHNKHAAMPPTLLVQFTACRLPPAACRLPPAACPIPNPQS
ncbi:hypothetical protein, partial [Xanthomonas hortorum]|uniref:hypothetical protein n=1 Tax=Xanthomonas hortorum TaxID=56454 RepID=UPI001B876E9F